jgi:hypothetical protein
MYGTCSSSESEVLLLLPFSSDDVSSITTFSGEIANLTLWSEELATSTVAEAEVGAASSPDTGAGAGRRASKCVSKSFL